VLATLSVVDHSPLHVPGWFVIFLIAKEVLQVLGAGLLSYYHGVLRIKPTRLAKITALIQMVFIIWLLACYNFGWLPLRTYYAMVATVFILQIIVFMHYAYIGFSSIKEPA
jgi:phosphatidylglycerophosphate synthase